MGTQNTRGFTIIESLLFLAITGLLIMTMIGGVGVSIQVQRYRDAVETFKTLLQDQYSELSSVKNEQRTTDWSCNGQAETEEGGSGARIRGQSDCVILGRYMSIVDSAITIYSVVGRPMASASSATGDIEKLRDNYIVNVSTITVEEKELEWGARIAWAATGSESASSQSQPPASRSLSLLFVRSPYTGQIYTFSSNLVPEEPSPVALKAMLTAGDTIPGQKDRTICIDGGLGNLFVGGDSSIYIDAYASGPSAIEVRSDGLIESLSSDARGGGIACTE